MTDYFLFYTFRSQIRFLQMKKSPLFTLPLRQTLFCEFPPMVISTAVFGKCPTKGAFLYTFSPLHPFVLDCQLFVYWHKRKRKSISKELVISLIQFKWWPPFVCNSHCHLFRQDLTLYCYWHSFRQQVSFFSQSIQFGTFWDADREMPVNWILWQCQTALQLIQDSTK